MPGELANCLDRWQVGLAEVGWNANYLGNHDQPRAVSRFGDDSPQWREASAKALATVALLLRGTPFIFQGEELGMTNSPWRSEDLRDVEALNYLAWAQSIGVDALPSVARMGRDNPRAPMQWDAGPSGGFTTGTP